MGKKQVTFADIAAYTNFSKTTISRYFNHPDSLTLENQEKISQALDTLGYKKNKLAKVLANGKSEFIGIIIPNLYLHYYSEMLTQILSSYRDFHYKFLVFVSDNGPSEEEQYIDELMAYQIEGLIVLSHTLSSEKLASYQIPVIAIEREAEHICGVTSDNYMGALQAATLLIRDKCDVLIHVNADVPKSIPAYDRIRAQSLISYLGSPPFHEILLSSFVHPLALSERVPICSTISYLKSAIYFLSFISAYPLHFSNIHQIFHPKFLYAYLHTLIQMMLPNIGNHLAEYLRNLNNQCNLLT